MKGMIALVIGTAVIVGAINYFAPEGKAAMQNAGNTYHAKYQVAVK